jgi:hypothetical protein
MIQSNIRRAWPLASLAICALAACTTTSDHSSASESVDRAAETAATAGSLSDGLAELQTNLRGLDTSLENVRSSVGNKSFFNRDKVAKNDVNAVFSSFQTSLDSVQAAYGRVESMNASLDQSMRAHLANWEQNLNSMQSGAVREASMQRRDEARTEFEEVMKGYRDVWQRTTRHVAGLEEIETALGNDLTPEGIDALDKAMAESVDENETIAKDLGKAATAMDELAAALRARGPVQN